VLSFLRAAKGEGVGLDTIKNSVWENRDSAALSRTLYGLKKTGKAKRLGHKMWAAATPNHASA
jgi:hypothetical protein